MPRADDPAASDRSRRMLVCYAVALALLGALGLFCWLVVGPALQAQRALAKFDKEHDYVDAMRVLGGPVGALPKLRIYLGLPRSVARYRHHAAWLLGQCGPNALPALEGCLSDKDAQVRAHAVWGVGFVRGREREAAALAERMLADPDPEVRGNAASTLGALWEHAQAAVPKLVALLNDPEREVRWQAACSLATIRVEADAAVPVLLGFLAEAMARPVAQDQSAYITAMFTIGYLGDFGPEAKAAIPALERVATMRDTSIEISSLIRLAKEALKKIRVEEKPPPPGDAPKTD